MTINFSRIAEQIINQPFLFVPIGVNLESTNPVGIDLSESPHTLIAGMTGFGKSSLINVIFTSVRMRNNDVRLVYINPLLYDMKNKKYPSCVEEYGNDDVNKQLKAEVKRMKGLYDKAKNYTLLVVDECSLICENPENTSLIEDIAKTGRHSNYCLFMITQFPVIESFGKSSLIKQNLHNQIVFRCGDSIRSTHSIFSKDIRADLLYRKGECFVRTPNILARYGKPLHCQAFYLDDKDIKNYISDKKAESETTEKLPKGITKQDFLKVLEYLKENRVLSGKLIREKIIGYRCQNDSAQKIVDLLVRKGYLVRPEKVNGKCQLIKDLESDLESDFARIFDSPICEIAESDYTTKKSNIINIEQYLQRN